MMLSFCCFLALFAGSVFGQQVPPELIALQKQVGWMELFQAQGRFAALDDERRERANSAFQEAQDVFDEPEEQLRLLAQATTLFDNRDWSWLQELGHSFAVRLDRHFGSDLECIQVSLVQLFGPELYAAAPVSVSLRLIKDPGPMGRVMRQPVETVAELMKATAFEVDSTGPAVFDVALPELPDGNYQVVATLVDEDGTEVELFSKPQVSRQFRVETQLEELEKALHQQSKRSADQQQAALQLASYPLQLKADVDRGARGFESAAFPREISKAREVLRSIEEGVDPCATPGLVRRTYPFEPTGEILPYMLFVPESYDPAHPTPLILALHGLGGTEDSYFEVYGDGLLEKLAEERGYLVVAPLGHRVDGFYSGVSEQDVMTVLEMVREEFHVDAQRIYLTGHSMGGFGSFALAARHPGLFAAIAPVAGGGQPSSVASFSHVPMFVVHGDADRVVPVAQSREMVEAAREAGAEVEYIEIKGGDHMEIVAQTLERMFDFFDEIQKPN
jgi:predicted esterase